MLLDTLGKSEVLKYLQNVDVIFNVPRLIEISFDEYVTNQNEIYSVIYRFFGDCDVAIRSSAPEEDGAEASMAGMFDSFLNVRASNKSDVVEKIHLVFDSYKRRNVQPSGTTVFIQEMVTDVAISGVAFSRDLDSMAPYFVINYDDITGSTDSVTSGKGHASNKLLCVHRDNIHHLSSPRFKTLLTALVELETLFCNAALDVEFAIDTSDRLHVLQVRKLITRGKNTNQFEKQILELINDNHDKLALYYERDSLADEKGNLFGQMPDWNPAEIIGRNPKKLAYSLYRYLITKEKWSQARANMGYHTVYGKELMIEVCGQPFIDVRASFETFIPQELPDRVKTRLVTSWLNALRENPAYHDKVEFEVATTCYSFDIDKRIDKLCSALSKAERLKLAEAYRNQLNNLIDSDHPANIRNLIAQQTELDNKFSEKLILVDSIPEILEMCREVGTLNFAMMARHGFIAKTLLASLVDNGVMKQSELHSFESSIQTVATDFVKDSELFSVGELTEEAFYERYGHLRPGTYEITIPRYDKQGYFGSESKAITRTKQQQVQFSLSDLQKNNIECLIKQHKLNFTSAIDFMDYITLSIQGREFGKFVFTKLLSHVLEKIASLGLDLNLSREELTHIDIQTIIKYYSGKFSNEDATCNLRQASAIGAQEHLISKFVKLPFLISRPTDVYIAVYNDGIINFITDERILSETVLIEASKDYSDLTQKIVIIENADPGFDWLFSHDIGGLITKFGGANSHMAIRCAEFGIPAAIGCGEQTFNNVSKMRNVLLDCKSKKISGCN